MRRTTADLHKHQPFEPRISRPKEWPPRLQSRTVPVSNAPHDNVGMSDVFEIASKGTKRVPDTSDDSSAESDGKASTKRQDSDDDGDAASSGDEDGFGGQDATKIRAALAAEVRNARKSCSLGTSDH